MTQLQIPQSDGSKAYQRTGPWIGAGLGVIVILIGGLVAWAMMASISGAVIATGVVRVESSVKTVQHLDGGIVSEIFVKNGDSVKAGDLLIRLDDTNTKANLAIANGRLHELGAARARLIAERDGGQIEFPPELVNEVKDSPAVKILDGQKLLFEARRASIKGQARVLAQKIVQLRDEVKGLEAQKTSKKEQSWLIREEIETIRPPYEKGHITRKRMLALERSAVQLDGEYGRHVSDIARARGAIGQTELEILQLDNNVREKVLTELRETQAKLVELQERKTALEDQLRRVEIRASTKGTVLNMAVHTIGGVVSPAQPIMQIIPQEDRLIIEAQIRPVDIDQIMAGQKAKIRFSAFNMRSTPELMGHVIKVSADSMTDKNTGQSYFLATLEVTDSELEKLGDNRLLPGMPAEAYIQTQTRTAISYLLKPLMDQFNRAFREE